MGGAKPLNSPVMDGPLTSLERFPSVFQRSEVPPTATSANLHEKPNIYDSREAIKEFNNRVHLIIDDGELAHNTPSTIYNIQEKRILRTGPVTELRIKQMIG